MSGPDDDAVSAIADCVRTELWFECGNCCTSGGIPLERIVDAVIEHLDRPGPDDGGHADYSSDNVEVQRTGDCIVAVVGTEPDEVLRITIDPAEARQLAMGLISVL